MNWRRSITRAHGAAIWIAGMAVLHLAWCSPMQAQAAEKPQKESESKASKKTTSKTAPLPGNPRDSKGTPLFAPMPADHPLASVWNDPGFMHQLYRSHGALSELEPKLNAEEQAYYRDVLVPLLRDDTAKAVQELSGRLKPESSAALDYTLANLYFQREDLTNAVKFFEQALTKFPDFRRAQKNLGFVLVRLGRYEEAIKPLSRTLSLGGADARVCGLLAFAHLSAQRYFAAEAAYKQALLFEPENLDFKMGIVKCLVATSNLDAALALLDELIHAHPDRDNLWALQANVYIQREQPAKAALNFEILRRMGKATAAQLFVLGDLYLSQESRDLALGAYQDAMRKDPGSSAARALRAADLLVGRGAFEEARTLFAQLRAAPGGIAGPDELKLLKLESKTALAAGDSAAAIRTLDLVIERNPLDGEALLLSGDCHARGGDREKADFRYETASKIQGFEADAMLKQAQLQVQRQKYVQALELLRKAQKLKPRDNVQRYLERVEQLARSGKA